MYLPKPDLRISYSQERPASRTLRTSQYPALHSLEAKNRGRGKKGIYNSILEIYKGMNILIKATQTAHLELLNSLR